MAKQETVTITVAAEMEGLRLDQFLAEQLTFSRSYLQKLIKNKKVMCNGNFITKSKVPVRLADQITIYIPEPEKIELIPENLNLDILYEDDDLLVVNKPKGMVVHPAAGHMSHTLVNGLLYHCAGHLSAINGVLRPGIVHRIDKDTTGALVVCKTDLAHQSIASQLSVHSVTRRYEAIVCHNLVEEEGTIDAPIGRHSVDRKRMAVVKDGNGRRAITHYRVKSHLNHQYNYIECQLETGRTHQIRVHMSYVQHPLLGDFVYGPQPTGYFSKLQGQTLHAKMIGFQHPRTNQYVEVHAPLPPYFVEVLEYLEK